MTREDATKKIAEYIAAAQTALNQAEALADEHRIGFSFSPAYGMGGHYAPEGGDADDDEWQDSDWESSDEGGWVSSSQQC